MFWEWDGAAYFYSAGDYLGDGWEVSRESSPGDAEGEPGLAVPLVWLGP